MSISHFEAELLKELTRIRAEFADRNLPRMSIMIYASGRVDSDDIRVTFTVDSDYDTKSVEGSSLEEAMKEFFRRYAWKKANDYLALPHHKSED